MVEGLAQAHLDYLPTGFSNRISPQASGSPSRIAAWYLSPASRWPNPCNCSIPCALLLKSYQNMSLRDFHRPRSDESYQVTPEWVWYYLTRHEAGHQTQKLLIKRLFIQQQR
jgi:hypothetical protein